MAEANPLDSLSLKEIVDKRNKLISRAREITDSAKKANRAMNTEERSEFDKLCGWDATDGTKHPGAIGELDEYVEAANRAGKWGNPAARGNEDEIRAARLAIVEARENPLAGRWIVPNNLQREETEEERSRKNRHPRATEEYRSKYEQWFRTAYEDFTPEETRALQMDADVSGGFLVAPQEFVKELIIFVNNLVFIRQLARVFTVENAESLGAPSLETDISDTNWTAEIATGVEDSSMAFGKRELRPHPCAKLIKVSDKLLRASVLNVEEIVRQRMAYKFGVVEETAFMTGTGVDQPLGVFTASSSGISTARDYVGANTTTAIAADALIGCFYNLKYQYQVSPNTRWGFHRTTIQNIRQLKDGIGQYLWQPGIAGGAPDTVYGKPYFMSEYVPSTYTAGQYVGIVGDFSFYWIADALDMRIQRLNELYAATAQVGFIGRKETDAMPVLEQAFSRLTLHA